MTSTTQRLWRWRPQLVAILVGGLAILAFAAGAQWTPQTSAEAVRVPLGPRNIFGVAWIADRTLAVGYHPDRDDSLFRLAAIDVLTGSLGELPEPPLGDCHRQRLLEPRRLPDLRLGFVRVCQPELGAGNGEHSTVVALELATGQFSTLALLDPYSELAGPYAVSADMQSIFVAVGSQICETVVRADARGALPIPIEVLDGDRRFRLDDPAALTGECETTGWATGPSRQPNGSGLAFFAAPAAIGVAGPRRARVPANLYVLDVIRNTVELAVRAVVTPRGLHYSPDGQTLAFAGTIGERSGTWNYRIGSNVAERVSDLEFSWLDWSPDGKRLVGLVDAGTNERPLDNELWILEAVARN